MLVRGSFHVRGEVVRKTVIVPNRPCQGGNGRWVITPLDCCGRKFPELFNTLSVHTEFLSHIPMRVTLKRRQRLLCFELCV